MALARTKGRIFAVCWKVCALRVDVDALSGEVVADSRSLGVSPADEAALEWALRCAASFGGRVRVVAVGGGEVEPVLRGAAARGAAELVRVDCDRSLPSESVASLLVAHVADAALVWCGDASVDRGSGSVPAFLAAKLDVGQALGVTGVELSAPGVAPGAPGAPGAQVAVEVLRRLERGRRERLRVRSPAVISCEGSTARLRRASLRAMLESRATRIDVVSAGPVPDVVEERVREVAPFRPRSRVVPPPSGLEARERIRELTGSLGPPARARFVRLDPEAAASAIIEALRSWSELELAKEE